jgi:hypothetical protein
MSGGAFAAFGLIVWQPQGFDARERGQRMHGMHEQRCLEVRSVAPDAPRLLGSRKDADAQAVAI